MSKASTIEQFIRDNEKKELLRFSTAGSIDDGKSTLIGRLLHDSKCVYDDHLSSIRRISKEKFSQGEIDFSLFTDGLKAEREQGITIDVAYRYFSTPKRKFIIADTPGHEQYTRNMATGASTANLAIILIDARNGVVKQTKRHAFITSLLGVPHMVVAVNKMDMENYNEDVFNRIKEDFIEFSAKLKIPDLRFLPVSALKGDNIVEHSERMPWYKGESLLEILENIHIASDYNLVDLRFPVQYVLRPHQDFRGYCGRVASGVIRKGDEVMVLPSMRISRIRSIATYDGDIDCAYPPMSVTVTLEDEMDVSRGDLLVHRHNLPQSGRHFESMLVWLGEAQMDMSRSYYIKHTTRTARLRIEEVRYRIDVNTMSRMAPEELKMNDIGRVVFTAANPIFHDSYSLNRTTGSFILIDPISNNTVAAGMIIERQPADQLPVRMEGEALSQSFRKHESLVKAEDRNRRYGQKPATVWLTGLVGSGKTEIAYELEKKLFQKGAYCMVLDGENFRRGVSRELGFSSEGTSEHLRRVAETARMINDAGLIVICGFVSPSALIRKQVSEIVGNERFLEVHLDASVSWCESHDKTGLFGKARRGEIKNFAGVDVPYEIPESPSAVIPVETVDVERATDILVDLLKSRDFFPS